MKSFKESVQLIYRSLRRYLSLSLILAGMLLTVRLYELVITSNFSGYPIGSAWYLLMGVKFDIIIFLRISAVLVLPFLLIAYFSQKTAKYFFVTFSLLLVLGDILLLQYFDSALVPLGADLFGYSIDEIKHTVKTSGGTGIFPVILMLLYLGYMFRVFVKHVYFRLKPWAVVLFVLLILSSFLPVSFFKQKPSAYNSEFGMYIANNKLNFFTESVANKYVFGGKPTNEKYVFKAVPETSGSNSFTYVDAEYPFLHKETTPNILGEYFNVDTVAPDIVFIIVESLGRAYSGDGAYLGSFTPFLDSLAEKSLYWENCLSTSGRTFQVLPSLLASAPYGEKGFADLGENMPDHLSLISILQAGAAYQSSFFYGGDSEFDKMNVFMNRQGISKIIDINNFGNDYSKLPLSQSGFSWGYGDREIFRRYVAERNTTNTGPRIDVMLTLAMHSPFLVNDQELYQQKFVERLEELQLDEKTKNNNLNYEKELASVIYFDESLKYLFGELKKQPRFNNSIFIITGDHRMPEIPISTQLDRFHVPLIVYSPMLKKSEKFASLVTHFDVTPSILALLNENQFVDRPDFAAWIGHGLDNSTDFRNLNPFVLMRNKNEILDLVDSENMLANGIVYQLFPNMYIEQVADDVKLTELKDDLNNFILKNNYVCQNNKLIPDSLLKWTVKK